MLPRRALRSNAWRWRDDQAYPLAKRKSFEVHTETLESSTISPDGTLLASVGSSWDYVWSIAISDIATGEKLYTVPTDVHVAIKAMAWSPDGTRLLAATFDEHRPSATPGRIIQITNNNTHSIVYDTDTELFACAFSPCGKIFAVGGSDHVLRLLDPFDNFAVKHKLSLLPLDVWKLAFSPDGNLLAVGGEDGGIYIYGLTNGNWEQKAILTHSTHSRFYSHKSLSFSPSGRMLLETRIDRSAAIWKVPSDATWPTTPHAKFGCVDFDGSAFLGDESHAVTLCKPCFIRIWRVSDGASIASIDTDAKVSSVSYHAASGTVSVGMYRGNVEIWQTDPYIAPALEAPLPAHACVRRQLVEAEAQAAAIGTLLGLTKDGSRRKSRGKEPARSTEDDESAKERHNELLGIVASCRHTIDSLTSSLSEYGLDELRGGEFSEWLCDIGMSKLQTTLKDLGGAGLTLLNVGDVMTYDVTFCDASALLLRAYIAHNKLSKEKAFSPPRDSVLSWNETQTANWIKTLDAPYHCLAKAGWHGAALCSLSPSRVVDACTAWSLSQPRGFGARTRTVPFGVPGAVKFIVMVRQMRSEVDGDKATWVTKWSGTSSIDHQAAL